MLGFTSLNSSSKASKPERQVVRATNGHIFTTLPTQEMIAERARQIYLQSGCREGQSEQNWFQAERELLTEAVAFQEEAEEEFAEEMEAPPIHTRGYFPSFTAPRLRMTGSMG